MKIFNFFRAKKAIFQVLFIAITIILFIGGCYLFFQNKKLFSQLREKDSVLKIVEENLELCYQDKAKVIKSYKLQYPHNEFKLSSPLFEEKEISVGEWFYKNDVVKEMVVEIEGEEGAVPILVKMWGFTALQNIKRQVIFDKYGNALPAEESSDRYNTAQGIVMFRSYGGLNKSKDISSIHSIYVQIIGARGIGLEVESALAEIRESTKDLEKIADTITF